MRRIPGEGPIPCKLMLIGERPGKDEDKQGRPFVGLAGQELTRYLRAGGLRRDDVYITNLVKTYRDGDKPEQWEIERDWDELAEEIYTVQPEVIALAGAYSIHSVLCDLRNVEHLHGVPVRAVGAFGYEATYFPMYHPAAGFYNPDQQPTILDDFTRLGGVCRGELTPIIDPYPRHLADYRTSVQPYALSTKFGGVGIDTEGWRHNPWCTTYSDSAGFARLIPSKDGGQLGHFARELEDMYRRGGLAYLHNSLHDLGVLRAMDVHVPEDKFRDTMVYAYLLCLEPQSLKQLAYRHCGMEMDAYEDLVGPANQELALEYLHGVAAGEWEDPEPYVIIKGGEPKVTKPQNIGRRVAGILRDIANGKTNKNGEAVDPRARWHKIDGYVRAQVEEQVGEMPEATLDDVSRESAEQYACRDADATIRLAPVLEARVREMQLEGISAIDHAVIPMVDRMQTVGMRIREQGWWDELTLKCEGIMNAKRYEIYKLTGATINPDSGDQVAELLFDQLRLPWTKLTKSKVRPSTNDKVLEALRSDHPVVPPILDYREASKVRSSFARPLPRLAGPDGRVRCNLRVTRVSSGRLAATNPNLLAIPVRSTLGREVRDGFVPEEGHLLGTWDQDQVEMRIMAHESADPVMCGIFREGKKDIHRMTGALIYGMKYEDVPKKGEIRDAAKRVGFGVITGITEHGLKDQMDMWHAVKPDGTPWSLDDCAQLIKEYFKVYTGVKGYMDECRAEARRNGFVRDMWGRIRYLPGVHSPVERIREEALRQSHSFKISSGAQGVMKQSMKLVWDCVIKELWKDNLWVEPLLQVHDEILCEFQEDLAEVVDPWITGIMCNTVQLRVPIRAKGGTGRSWAQLEK